MCGYLCAEGAAERRDRDLLMITDDRLYSTSLMLLTSAKVIIKFEYTMIDD